MHWLRFPKSGKTAFFRTVKDRVLFKTASAPKRLIHVFNPYICGMGQKPVFTIRKGAENDVVGVFALIKELALYEKAPEQVTLTLDELKADGFGPNPIYDLFVAEMGNELVGIALYYEKYSTWTGRCTFLEDIIVTESKRGMGIGHALFQAVIGAAKERNSARIEWQVLDWNEPAINFYKKYDAALDPEWLNGKLTRKQIQEFRTK